MVCSVVDNPKAQFFERLAEIQSVLLIRLDPDGALIGRILFHPNPECLAATHRLGNRIPHQFPSAPRIHSEDRLIGMFRRGREKSGERRRIGLADFKPHEIISVRLPVYFRRTRLARQLPDDGRRVRGQLDEIRLAALQGKKISVETIFRIGRHPRQPIRTFRDQDGGSCTN